MIYKIKMTLEGEFPGSPDHDNYIVDEKTWSKIRDIIVPNFDSENSLFPRETTMESNTKKP